VLGSPIANTIIYFSVNNTVNGSLFLESNSNNNITLINTYGSTLYYGSELLLVGNTPVVINNGTWISFVYYNQDGAFVLNPGTMFINTGVWIMGNAGFPKSKHDVFTTSTSPSKTIGTIYNLGLIKFPAENDNFEYQTGYTGDFYQCSNAVMELHLGGTAPYNDYSHSVFDQPHLSGTLNLVLDTGGNVPTNNFPVILLQFTQFKNTTGKLNMVLNPSNFGSLTLCFDNSAYSVYIETYCYTQATNISANPSDDCPAWLFTAYKDSIQYSGTTSGSGSTSATGTGTSATGTSKSTSATGTGTSTSATGTSSGTDTISTARHNGAGLIRPSVIMVLVMIALSYFL